jgi:hypothetical protein
MGYIENFIKAILDNSISEEYEIAIKEWTWYGEQTTLEDDETSRCCCGHIIQDIRIVRNDCNKRTLEVGNCCIKKFGIERKHFNGSKIAYLMMGLTMSNSPGSRDYLRYETLPRIESERMFTELDLRVLEKVTGRKSRFKPFEHSAKRLGY